jgi:type I restriction enzyme S subunit
VTSYYIQQGKAISGKHRQGKAPYPFLRTSNVYWGQLDLTSLDTMDFSDQERERLQLKRGDLLVCEGGEIGRTAILDVELSSQKKRMAGSVVQVPCLFELPTKRSI